MAETLTLSLVYAANAAVIAAPGYSAYESHKQATQQAKNAETNARMQQAAMELNQRQEKKEAELIEAEGRENARRMRIAAQEARAQRIAMLGKSGAAMNSGSPLAILGDAAADEELQIQDHNYQVQRQAAAHYNQAAAYGYQARIAAINAREADKSKPSALSLGANVIANTTETGLKLAAFA